MINVFKEENGMRRAMIKGKKVIFFELFCLAVLLLNGFGLNFFREITLIVFIIAFFVASFLLFGYRKNKSIHMGTIINIVIIWCLSFVLLQYIAGLFFGFLTTSYATSFPAILKNIAIAVATIIASELVRYAIVFKNGNNKLGLALAVAIFALLDVTIRMNYVTFSNSREAVLFYALYLLPSISKAILLTYMSKKVGCRPCIVYRLLMEIYVFFVPLFTDLGDYFKSLLYVAFPLVLLYRLFVFFRPKEKSKVLEKNYYRKILTGVVFVFLLTVAALTSNMFRFYALVIASGSMQPTIYVGDIVIVDKYYKDHPSEINEGEILTFVKDNRAISHRVVSSWESEKGCTFKTKGDANNDVDVYEVTEKEIMGTVKLKVPFVGYLAVWLYDMTHQK